MKLPVAIVGDGFAALYAAANLVALGRSVVWIAGSGDRIHAPISAIPRGHVSEFFEEIHQAFSVPCERSETSSLLREYRNKTFREPLWVRATDLDQAQMILDEELWDPEARFVEPFLQGFTPDLAVLDRQLRLKILESPEMQRIEGTPVHSIEKRDDESFELKLGNGRTTWVSEVIFADRPALLREIQGLKNPSALLQKLFKGRDPVALLQVTFHHSEQVGKGYQNSFYLPLNRETGEEASRRVWGYFSDNGRQSVWSIFMEPEEAEDNALVGKRIRRLKQTLSKAFEMEGRELADTILKESVRLTENSIFSRGKPPELGATCDVETGGKIHLFWDLFGLGYSLRQVMTHIGFTKSETEANHLNLGDPILNSQDTFSQSAS